MAPGLNTNTSTYPVTTVESAPRGSFNLIRALGLNADCPCWAWILIVFSAVLLLALIGMCLYFILGTFISLAIFTGQNKTISFFLLTVDRANRN